MTYQVLGAGGEERTEDDPRLLTWVSAWMMDGTLGQAGDPGWEQCWAKMMNLVSNTADSEGCGGP